MDKIAAELKETLFLQCLLNEFVSRGLGSLPGRETTIALVKLLLEHHPDWKKSPPTDFEIARLLRTSPRKVRNIRDELAYRNEGRGDVALREELNILLMNAEKIRDGSSVAIQIDDGLLRDFTRDLLRQKARVVEKGIDGTILKLSGEAFLALCVANLSPDDHAKLEEEFADVPDLNFSEGRTYKDMFLKALVTRAGDEVGSKLVRLGFALLTGGASEFAHLLSSFVNRGQSQDE